MTTQAAQQLLGKSRLEGCVWPGVSPLGSTPSTCSHTKTPCCASSKARSDLTTATKRQRVSHCTRPWPMANWHTIRCCCCCCCSHAPRAQVNTLHPSHCHAERRAVHGTPLLLFISELRCLPAQHAEANSAHHSRCLKRQPHLTAWQQSVSLNG